MEAGAAPKICSEEKAATAEAVAAEFEEKTATVAPAGSAAEFEEEDG